MTTADDNESYGRLVNQWTLYGSTTELAAGDDGWVTLSGFGSNNFVQRKNFYTQRFFCDKSTVGTAYQYFKLVIDDTDFIQFSEFSFCYEKQATVTYNWSASSQDGSTKAVDWLLGQKWEGNNLAGNYVTIKTADEQPHTVKSYSFSTHDDGSYTGRAPKTWIIEGSNDNSTWTTIDEVTEGDPIDNANYKTFEFTPSNVDDAFTYVRLTLNSMKGTGWTQVGEFHVVGACASHTWVSTTYVAPTCVTEGGGEMQCSVCGVKKLTDVEPATGVHTYVDGLCSVCGAPQTGYMTANEGYYEPTTLKHFNWLAAMIQAGEGETFKIRLTQDVDLTDFGGFGNGDDAVAFAGEFDGQHHWLKNLTITSEKKNTGLFGKTDGANLHDFGFVNANVKISANEQNAGIVVGNANNTTISFIAVAYGSKVEGYDHVGSLVGNSTGTTNISNCYSDAYVKSRAYQAGGLVGTTKGLTLAKCLFAGEIRNENYNSSGLVSLLEADNGATINNCVMAASTISSGSSSAAVVPIIYPGSCKFTDSSYYTNNRVSNATVFKKSSTTQDYSHMSGDDHNGILTDDADLRTNSFYTGTMGWDMVNVWYIVEGRYPVLKWMVDIISTPAELAAFAEKVNGGNVNAMGVLTADINMTSTEMSPIGNTTYKYKGYFNGQFHNVTLNMTNSEVDYQGLFGVLAGGAQILNVITKGTVTGKNYVGGIAGGSNGGGTIYIKQCGNEANVTASGANGAGVFGVNMGSAARIELWNCYNTGTIKSNADGGALSGWLGGNNFVQQCFNIGEATNTGNSTVADNFRNSGGTHNNNFDYRSGETAIASGELCFGLDQTYYRQNIGEDDRPVLNSSHNMVYKATSNTTNYYHNGTVASMVLTDLQDYSASADFTATSLTYNRTLAAGGYHSLCLPFAVTTTMLGEGSKLFTLGEVGANSVTLTQQSEVAAGVPCFASVTSDFTFGEMSDVAMESSVDNSGTLKGSFTNQTINAGFYKLSQDGTYFGLTTEGATVSAFRSYISVPAGVKTLNILLSDGTSITVPTTESENQPIYDLSGRQVQKMTKGLYIVNGKKVLK